MKKAAEPRARRRRSGRPKDRGAMTRGALAEAWRTFRDELDLPARIALAHEIVETRADELKRAYPDVEIVAYGFRRRKGRSPGRRIVKREACVALVVKRKRPEEEIDARRRLPRYLLAYATVDGARKLCAVPTDVEDGREHGAIRPQARIIVTPKTGVHVHGVVACTVTRSSDNRQYAVSCRHVFGATPDLDPFKFFPIDVSQSGEVIGRAAPIRGHIDDAIADSLDAQLALLNDGVPTLAATELVISGTAKDESDLWAIADCFVVTPGRAVRASIAHNVGPQKLLDYRHAGVRAVSHEALFSLNTTSGVTKEGDSGSPVLTRRDGGTLLGMLIAGPAPAASTTEPLTQGTSYMIPAWHLLDPRRYLATQDGETWTVL